MEFAWFVLHSCCTYIRTVWSKQHNSISHYATMVAAPKMGICSISEWQKEVYVRKRGIIKVLGLEEIRNVCNTAYIFVFG